MSRTVVMPMLRKISLFALVLCASCSHSATPKIGFLVKMPEQGWFISEQKGAAEAGPRSVSSQPQRATQSAPWDGRHGPSHFECPPRSTIDPQ